MLTAQQQAEQLRQELRASKVAPSGQSEAEALRMELRQMKQPSISSGLPSVTPNKISTGIDPALQAQLEKRGMTDKLAGLQETASKASVAKQLPGAIGDMFVGAEKAFGNTLGTALATTTGQDQKINQASVDSADSDFQMAKLMNDPNTDPEQKERIRQQLSRGRPEVQNAAQQLPSINKSAKQIFGEGLGVAADIASVGSYGKVARAAEPFKLITASPSIAAKAPGILGANLTSGTLGARGARALGKEGAILGGLQGASRGMREDKSAAGVFKSGLGGAALGGAIGFTAGALGQALQRKKLAPFAGKTDSRAAEAMRRLELSPTASQVSKSPTVSLIEGVTAKSIKGDRLAGRIQTFHDDLGRIASETVEEAGSSSSPVEIGQRIIDRQEKIFKTAMGLKNDLYDNVPFADLKKVGVTPIQTKQILNEILERKRGAGSFAQDTKWFEKLARELDDVGDDAAVRVSRAQKAVNAKGKPVTILQNSGVLENMRTPKNHAADIRFKIQELGRKIDNFNDPVTSGNKGDLKRLWIAMTQDLDSALGIQDKALKEALDAADDQYVKVMGMLDSDLGKMVEKFKDRPDQLVKVILNDKTSIAQIPTILDSIGPENANNLRANLLNDIFTKSRNDVGRFKPSGINSQLRKFGGERLSAIFSPEQVQVLQDMGTATATLAKINKLTEGSQTAFIVKAMLQFGNFFANPFSAIASLFGDAALGNFVSSSTGQKFLLEGIQNPQVIQQAGRAVEKVGQIGSRVLPRYLP